MSPEGHRNSALQSGAAEVVVCAYGNLTVGDCYNMRETYFGSAAARKVADGHNLDHCLGHPVARRRRWLLRVQSVWWVWDRRRSGLGTDHSSRTLVLRRPTYQSQSLIYASRIQLAHVRYDSVQTGDLCPPTMRDPVAVQQQLFDALACGDVGGALALFTIGLDARACFNRHRFAR